MDVSQPKVPGPFGDSASRISRQRCKQTADLAGQLVANSSPPDSGLLAHHGPITVDCNVCKIWTVPNRSTCTEFFFLVFIFPGRCTLKLNTFTLRRVQRTCNVPVAHSKRSHGALVADTKHCLLQEMQLTSCRHCLHVADGKRQY